MIRPDGTYLHYYPIFGDTGVNYAGGVVFNPVGLTMGRGRYIKLGIRYIQNVTNAATFRLQVSRGSTSYVDITSALTFPTGNAGQYKEVVIRTTDIVNPAYRELSNIDQVRVSFPTAPNGQTAISLIIS